MTRGPRTVLAAAALAVLSASVLPAVAADPDLIADLDAPDLATRERATELLSVDPSPERLDRLQEALADPGLSPEQRVRLREAAQRVFDNLERAGLGVSFVRTEGPGPVEIGGTIEGFPAHMLLRRGDRIVAIDGQTLETTSHMRWMILSRGPGDALEMDLLRPRPAEQPGVEPIQDRLTVLVPLGRYSDLENGREVARSDLRAALDLRLATEGAVDHPAAGVRPVGLGISPEEWLAAEGLWPDFDGDALFPGADATRAVPADAARAAAVGGQPLALDGADALLAADVSHQERQDNRRLSALDSRGPWESPVTLVRVNARQIIDIDRRLHHGVGRVSRPVSLNGLRRERHQLTQGLIHAARAVTLIPPGPIPEPEPDQP